MVTEDCRICDCRLAIGVPGSDSNRQSAVNNPSSRQSAVGNRKCRYPPPRPRPNTRPQNGRLDDGAAVPPRRGGTGLTPVSPPTLFGGGGATPVVGPDGGETSSAPSARIPPG